MVARAVLNSLVCFVFCKVGDLQYASPSTVSRCGMVYVDPKNLGYHPCWERWVGQMSSESDKVELIRLFDKYVPECIALILEGIQDGRQLEKLRTIVPLSNLNMVKSKPNFKKESIFFPGKH